MNQSARVVPELGKRWISTIAIDIFLVVGILAWAGFYLRSSPEFAANLPQDGTEYSAGAVSVLEHRGVSFLDYGRSFGLCHPFGSALMLVPGYAIAGHFIGNGIYAILGYALAAIALTYVVGRWLGGRLTGGLAAVFLAGHHGFRIYSQRIMVEVPTCFLFVFIFAAVLVLRTRHRSWAGHVLVGLAAGLAICVRTDNALLLCGVIPLLWRNSVRSSITRCAWVILGVIPCLIALAAYNQIYFGDVHWSGVSYYGYGWEESPQPLFSTRYLTARGYWTSVGFTPEQAALMDGNLIYYIKSVFGESDQSLPFGPAHWSHPKPAYQVLIVTRTLLGVLGLWYCFRRWRTQPAARDLLVWLIGCLATYFVFFILWRQQEDRYLLRLAPFFCLLNSLGVRQLCNATQLLPQRFAGFSKIIVISAGCGFAGTMAWASASNLPYHGDRTPPRYEMMQTANLIMESNAVVVTTFWDSYLEACLIKGTERTQIPFVRGVQIVPGKGKPKVMCGPFSALEEPGKLLTLMSPAHGERLRPPSFLVDTPSGIRSILSAPIDHGLVERRRLPAVQVDTAGGGHVAFGRMDSEPGENLRPCYLLIDHSCWGERFEQADSAKFFELFVPEQISTPYESEGWNLYRLWPRWIRPGGT